MVKNPPANAGRHKKCGLDPWVGKTPEGGRGNPLQCFCLEKPRAEELGRLQSTGVAQSQT